MDAKKVSSPFRAMEKSLSDIRQQIGNAHSALNRSEFRLGGEMDKAGEIAERLKTMMLLVKEAGSAATTICEIQEHRLNPSKRVEK